MAEHDKRSDRDERNSPTHLMLSAIQAPMKQANAGPFNQLFRKSVNLAPEPAPGREQAAGLAQWNAEKDQRP